MNKIRSLKQYNIKYKKVKSELLQFTKKELEIEAKSRGCNVEYILKGRKWLRIGDTYCEIPKLFSFKWIKNIRTSVQILTCSLLVGGAATAVAVPVSINIINNTIESSNGSLNIKTEKSPIGDTLVHISSKDTEKRVASFTIKKGDVELIENKDYTVATVSLDETLITIKKESFDNIPGRLVITPTLEVKCSISLDKTHVSMNMTNHKTDKLTATVTGYSKTVKWTSSDNNVCKVTDGNLTAINNGQCTITAEANEKIATCSINIYTPVETLTLSEHSVSLNLKDITTQDITPTVTPSEATITDVDFKIESGDDVISLSSSSVKSGSPLTITALKNGNARIKAMSESKVDYCDVTVDTALERIDLSDTHKDLSLASTTESQFDISATVFPVGASTQTIEWSVTQDDTYISLSDSTSESGSPIHVTGLKNGNATIKASAGGKSSYCTVTVDTPITGIEINPTELELSLKDSTTKTKQVTATVNPTKATQNYITWSIESGADVIEIDATKPVLSGTPINVTAVKNGSATLKASAGDKSATCNVTVDTALEGLQLSTNAIDNLDLETLKETTIYGTVTPSTATKQTITWSIESSSPEEGYSDVISISSSTSQSGEEHPITITAVGNGTARLKAEVDGKYAQYCDISIHTKVNKITLNPTSLSLDLTDEGKTKSVTATVNTTAYNKNINWSIKEGEEDIIDIDDTQTKSGESINVTAKKNGKATIIVESDDGSKSVQYSVVVATAVSSLTLSKETMNLSLSGSTKIDTIHADILPVGARDRKITWSLVDPGDNPIVKLSKTETESGQDITVTALLNGTVVLKASVGGKEATCSITVDTKVESIKLSKTTMKLDLITTISDTIYATISPDVSTTRKVKWKVTGDNDIVSISTEETKSGEEGLTTITALKNGSTTLVAYTGSGESYVESDTCTITVDTAITDFEISKTEMTLAHNNTKKNTGTIHGTITPAEATIQDITWTLNKTGIINISSSTSKSGVDITITAVSAGTVTLTATAGTIVKTCTITVYTDVTSITCNSSCSVVVDNDVEFSELNVTVLPETASDKTYTVTSSDEAVAKIEDGKIKTLNTGKTTLTITSNLNSEVYNTCILSVTNPLLDWDTTTRSGFGNKTLKTVAFNSYKIIFGLDSKYESEVEGLDAVQVGERDQDKIYAYIKDSGLSTQTLYILSSKPIAFENDDTIKMFQQYNKTGGVIFENVDTTLVTSMQSMFGSNNAYDTHLGSKLDLTNFDVSNVTSMSSIFFRFKADELDISTWNTKNVTDMSSMFMYAKSKSTSILKVFASDSFVVSNVTSYATSTQQCDLQGARGTVPRKIDDIEYLRVDKEDSPGVFWPKE